MQEDYADIVARECGSSSAHSCSKQDSTRCQTGESKDSKRSLALSNAEVSFRAIVQKWVPYSQRYLFNAIPDTNHNANLTNPNRYSKGNPNPTNPTNPTNPNTRYRCE